MPFDGIVINALVKELKEKLIGGRIDKVHQPEKDELLLFIRSAKENYKLMISVDSRLAHVTLTESKKENPNTPPMFCMLMRKHMAGSKIIDISQVELERIIKISIESRNELGDMITKDLIIEIMGKHSNIILIERETVKIIDSIKRIPFGTSRSRQLLPGLAYESPPLDKKNIMDTDESVYLSSLDEMKNCEDEIKAFQHIYMTYQGISPVIGKNICRNASVDPYMLIQDLSSESTTSIWNEIVKLNQTIANGDFHYNVIVDKNDVIKDFSSIELHLLKDNADNKEILFDSTTEIINKFFGKQDFTNRNMQKSTNLRKTVSSKISKLKKKIDNLNKDMSAAENLEEFKILGDLIIGNIYNIKKGDSEAIVVNYYDENSSELNIPLDKRLSPSENAQKYFKRYNKSKTAIIKVREQLDIATSEIEYLEQVLVTLENTVELNNLEDIRQELVQEGYVKQKYKQKKSKKVKSSPYKYISTDGMTILVGKNNLQNDELTLKYASKSDIWLHTKIIPGSHVIIRTEGQAVSDQTIKEAAILAAYYSKARTSNQVPVDYTEVRNVKKPNGAKPGMVIYETNHTVYADPEKNQLIVVTK